MPIYVTLIPDAAYARYSGDRTSSFQAVSTRRLFLSSSTLETRILSKRDLLSLPFISAPFDYSLLKKSEKKTPPVNGVYGQGAAFKVSHRRHAVNNRLAREHPDVDMTLEFLLHTLQRIIDRFDMTIEIV